MKQLIGILIMTALFTCLGIWWLRSSQAIPRGQFSLETNQALRIIEVRAVNSELVVGEVEVRAADTLSVLTVRAGLPSPAPGTEYEVLGIRGEVRQSLGSMNLGNGNQYFLTYQQPAPIQFDELTIQLRSLEDTQSPPLVVAKANW